MRQGILIGVRPIQSLRRQFSRSSLGAGSWKFVAEHRIDTKIQLTIYSKVSSEGGEAMMPRVAELPDEPSVLTISGPCEVSAEITHAGREEYINLFAQMMGK